MSISPCTTIGNSPNAIRPNTTKKAAEFIRLLTSRKYGDSWLDQMAARMIRATSSSSAE